ncbi:MAG: penicillin-binding protein 2 [Candidatus Wildermuthbacteria bacterium]|nr:penicillin-binding protein 2 [Candidatus Wildermuthbacteria bacterium]
MKQYWRSYLILFLILFVGASLVGRLLFLQVVRGGFYKALAQGQQGSSLVERGERGKIFARDKNGGLVLLAANQKVPYAFVSPVEIEKDNEESIAETLASILGMEKAGILSRVQSKESFFEVIKKRIAGEEAKRIVEKDMKGMHVGFETLRVYPQGSFASHVLGFVNQEDKGQYGIESSYNQKLAGKEGIKRNVFNPASYFLGDRSSSAKAGENVVLTIDYNIQSVAEALLLRAKKDLGVEEGTIVVMDPRDGKILSLANSPSFDPNEYAKEDLSTFQNAAVEKIFEPGSVLKAITMASALEEGSVTPETTYEDKGILRIGGYKILNYDNRTWGERTMREVLQFSINTGAVFAAEQLGFERFMEYLKKFGIFSKTFIDLPGEVFSQNKELQLGHEINFATASFGQGIEMTPLQLMRAYAAIANGGMLVTPHIVEQKPSDPTGPILSSKTVLDATAMLVSVMEEGYGKSARVPGYFIAGKTGTAQIPWSALGVQKAGYSDQTIQSFIGYAPAYNPQFLVLVKLNNPKTKTAEYSAVPLFKELTKYIIDYLEIPPDYE